jgi:hypothetical protein
MASARQRSWKAASRKTMGLWALVVVLLVSTPLVASLDSPVRHLDETADDNPRNVVKEAWQALTDPSTMRSVESLMNDPDFIKQMERMKSNPKYTEVLQSAKNLFKDSEAAARLIADLSEKDKQHADHSTGAGPAHSRVEHRTGSLQKVVDLLKEPAKDL